MTSDASVWRVKVADSYVRRDREQLVIKDWIEQINPCCLLRMIYFISSMQSTYQKLRWMTVITLRDSSCSIPGHVGTIRWIKAFIEITSLYRHEIKVECCGHVCLWANTSVETSQRERWIFCCTSQQVSWSLDRRSHVKPLPHMLQLSSAHPASPRRTQQIEKQTRQALGSVASLW